MKKQEFYFQSKDLQTNIHMVMWEPDDLVRGVLQIVHGEMEHMGMYEELGTYYSRGGIVVVGIDLIGHGMSTNNGTIKMTFGGEGSFNFVVDDEYTCFSYVKSLYPDVPYILMGVSMGAIVARSFLINYPGKIDGSILSGCYDLPISKLHSLDKKVRREIKKNGENVLATKMKKISVVKFNKKFKNARTPYDWLLKSSVMLNQFVTDPLKGDVVTNALVREILYGIRFVQNEDKMRLMDTNKPVLILAGKEDVATNYGADAKKIYDDFKKCNLFDVTYNVMDGLRHDLLHDDNRYTIYDFIYGWINNKMFRGIPTLKDEVLANGGQAVVQIQDKVLKAAKAQHEKEESTS